MSNEEILENIRATEIYQFTGFLYSEKNMIEAMNQARIDTIKQCARRANTHKTGNSGSWFDASVDKQSILSLIDEIQ